MLVEQVVRSRVKNPALLEFDKSFVPPARFLYSLHAQVSRGGVGGSGNDTSETDPGGDLCQHCRDLRRTTCLFVELMNNSVSFADGEAVSANTDEELQGVAGGANQDYMTLRQKAEENGCPYSNYNPPMPGRYTI